MPRPTIRPYREDDWTELWPIIAQTIRAQETYAVDPDLSEEEARAFWLTGRVTVATDEAGRVRGSGHAYPNREGPGGHLASASFMVAPDSQGEGVGRRLVEDVIAWARDEGYAAIQFNAVVEGNVGAEVLYADLGFTTIGTVPRAFRSPTRGEVGLHVMHLPLDGSATSALGPQPGAPLRLVHEADAPALAALFERDRAHFAPYEPDHDAAWFTAAGQRARIRTVLADHRAGRCAPFVIVEEGEVVGTLDLNGIVRGPVQSAAVGYRVGSGWTGRGLATRALRAAARHAFDDLGLHRLQAETQTDNAASRAVLARCRFEEIGHIPSYLRIGGQWRDVDLWHRVSGAVASSAPTHTGEPATEPADEDLRRHVPSRRGGDPR